MTLWDLYFCTSRYYSNPCCFSSYLPFVTRNTTTKKKKNTKRKCGTSLYVHFLSTGKGRVGVLYIARLWACSSYCTSFNAWSHYEGDLMILRDDELSVGKNGRLNEKAFWLQFPKFSARKIVLDRRVLFFREIYNFGSFR